MKKLFYLLLLSGLALIACDKQAPFLDIQAPDTPLNTRGTFVPFRASVSLKTIGFGDKCEGTSAEVAIPIIQGTGKATHLGKITITSEHCLFRAPSSMPFTVQFGEATLEAANGDELVINYDGTWSTDPSAQEIRLNTDYEIIGGTGRFEHAQGSGQYNYVAYFPDWPPNPPNDVAIVTGEFIGNIAY